MLKELYREVFGVDPGEIEAIASSGSNRRNYRVFRDEALGDDSSVPASVIFTEGQSVAENNAFIQLARYFYSMGLPVPNIYGVSDDRLCYLQKDLGYDSLFEHLDNMELVRRAGRSVYLKPSAEVLHERLIVGTKKRPLLADKNDAEILTFMREQLAWREPYYQKAEMTFNASNLECKEDIHLSAEALAKILIIK